MRVAVEPTAEAAGARVATTIVQFLRQQSNAVLGLATGSSTLHVYESLRNSYRSGQISFKQSKAFLLDEYVGLGPNHPSSYRSFVRRVLADHVDLPSENLFGPDGRTDDIHNEARNYEAAIASVGGIDLQLLGIGRNGHIGFNEPSSSLASRTRPKTLAQDTRKDNARFFHDRVSEVPKFAVTQGIGTIMEARSILLIATGIHKADAVHRMIEGPITAMVPASALQLHPHATVVLDEAAACDLSLINYFRECQESLHDPLPALRLCDSELGACS